MSQQWDNQVTLTYDLSDWVLDDPAMFEPKYDSAINVEKILKAVRYE